MLRRLEFADMDAAARTHRAAFDDALPWLAGLHTPQEDRAYFREHVFTTCELWGAFGDAGMAGLIAFRQDWIDQLYVLPEAQGRGLGSALLQVAKNASTRLQLWTFQRNRRARRFYEARGFLLVEETDGANNEEKEPDARYLWTRPQARMIRAQSLAALPNIRHAFFTREGGVSEGIYASLNGGLGSKDAPDKVGENRSRMAAALGVAQARFLTCYQVHSPNVVVAQAPWTRDSTPQADAIVTREPGLAVGVLTADCGPLLFADAEAGVVGAAHSGWKGALGGVLEATVAAMEQLGARRDRIRAALGPLIRQENYEVGAEFVARFTADDPANARYFVPSAKASHAMFDLPSYIAARLARAGVALEDLELCTYADPARFFSYRRTTHRAEPDYGRHVNAIVLSA